MSRYFQERSRGLNKRARTRGILLDSALDVFAESGISNTRLDDITKYAGMANATFYNHFKDKDELITALAKAIALELIAPVDERLAGIKDAPVRIVVANNIIMHAALEQKSWSTVLGGAFYLLPPRYIDVGSYLKLLIARGVEEGSFTVTPDNFQLDQVTAVFISGLRTLDKGDVNIIDRTAQNMLRVLGMSPAKVSSALEKGHAFYS